MFNTNMRHQQQIKGYEWISININTKLRISHMNTPRWPVALTSEFVLCVYFVNTMRKRTRRPPKTFSQAPDAYSSKLQYNFQLNFVRHGLSLRALSETCPPRALPANINKPTSKAAPIHRYQINRQVLYDENINRKIQMSTNTDKCKRITANIDLTKSSSCCHLSVKRVRAMWILWVRRTR